MLTCPFTKHGLTVRSDGLVAPCCAWEYKDVRPVFYTNENFKSTFDNIEKNLNNNVWPAGCIECEAGEQAGKTSMRSRAIRDNTFANSVGIEYWDFKLNTTCNLMCKMCGAHSSSSWTRESHKHPEIAKTYHGNGRNKPKLFKHKDGIEIEYFYPYLIHAKFVKFTGGEPFLIPEVRQCVEFLVDSEASYNIRLHFITNGTQDITDWIPLFKQFKHVFLSISIDAVGELYEYIRQGASWEQVSSNLIAIKNFNLPNLKLNIIGLPMSINHGKLVEVEQWCKNNNIDYSEAIDCISPAIMSPRALVEPELKQQLISHLETLDRIYNTDYKKVIDI